MKRFIISIIMCLMLADACGNSLSRRGGFSSAGFATAERERVRPQSEQMMWIMDERDRAESEDKARQEKASADYARNAKIIIESASVDGSLTLKACIEMPRENHHDATEPL